MNGTLQIRQRSNPMPLDGWTATSVFFVTWQVGIWTNELVGVYRDLATAKAAFHKRANGGHGGGKGEPVRQDPSDRINERQAIVRDDQFIPIGDWFYALGKNIAAAANLSFDKDRSICTFGDAPPDTGR